MRHEQTCTHQNTSTGTGRHASGQCMIDMSLPVAGGSGVALLHQCQGDITDTTSGENLLIARPPNEHTREPHSQPRTPLRRIWLITLSNTNPIELQGIVGNKTLHTLATYRRLCIYHTLPNNIGISSSSVIVIIQGDVSVFILEPKGV